MLYHHLNSIDSVTFFFCFSGTIFQIFNMDCNFLDELPFSNEDNSIFDAIENKDIQTLKMLMTKGYDLNEKNRFGTSPLHLAISKSNLRIVKVLIENGASPDVFDASSWNFTPLQLAMKMENYEIVKFLVENGANINLLKGYHHPLKLAIKNFEIFKYFMKNGAIMSDKLKGNITFILIDTKREEFFKYVFLNYIHHPNFTSGGCPQIFLAIYKKCEKIAELLIQHGAEIIKSRVGSYSTLAFASTTNNLKIVRLLIENGAKINPEDRDTYQPIQTAVRFDQIIVAHYFLSFGACANARNQNNENSLELSIRKTKIEFFKLFVYHQE